MENRIKMGNAVIFSKLHSDNQKEEYLTDNNFKVLHKIINNKTLSLYHIKEM
jgi:hypothetical protein